MHVCAAKLCRCLSAEHIYDDVVQLAHVSPTRQCALLQPSFPATLHTPSHDFHDGRGTEEGGGTAAVAARVVLARAGSQLAGTRAGRVTTGVSSSLLCAAAVLGWQASGAALLALAELATTTKLCNSSSEAAIRST